MWQANQKTEQPAGWFGLLLEGRGLLNLWVQLKLKTYFGFEVKSQKPGIWNWYLRSQVHRALITGCCDAAPTSLSFPVLQGPAQGTSQRLSLFPEVEWGIVWATISTVSTFGAKFLDLENQILGLYEENNHLPPLFTKNLTLVMGHPKPKFMSLEAWLLLQGRVLGRL